MAELVDAPDSKSGHQCAFLILLILSSSLLVLSHQLFLALIKPALQIRTSPTQAAPPNQIKGKPNSAP